MSRAWSITPLHVGTLHRKRCEFLWRTRDTAPFDAAVLMFLLESEGTRVLVDTGCSDPERSLPDHHPFSRTDEQHPLAALAALGVSPADVSVVINTHLHWDHCSGNGHFGHARTIVQREELRYAAAPLPWARRSYAPPADGETPPWASSAFEAIEGDVELLEGLHVVASPGHSPGSQTVFVDGLQRRYALAGDNVPLYDNLTPRGSAWPFTPNENHHDLSVYARSMERLLASGATVLPSHDLRVLEHRQYV